MSTKRKVPQTSLDAWNSITEDQKKEHHSKILEALRVIKRGSSEQISTHTNLTYWQVTKRMSELEKKKLVYKTGTKTATRTGRSAEVYALGNPDEKQKETEQAMPGKSISDYSKDLIAPTLF